MAGVAVFRAQSFVRDVVRAQVSSNTCARTILGSQRPQSSAQPFRISRTRENRRWSVSKQNYRILTMGTVPIAKSGCSGFSRHFLVTFLIWPLSGMPSPATAPPGARTATVHLSRASIPSTSTVPKPCQRVWTNSAGNLSSVWLRCGRSQKWPKSSLWIVWCASGSTPRLYPSTPIALYGIN